MGRAPVADPHRGASKHAVSNPPDLWQGCVAHIERRSAFTTEEKRRAWFNQLFRFAMVKIPGLEQNPASDLDVVALPKPPVIH